MSGIWISMLSAIFRGLEICEQKEEYNWRLKKEKKYNIWIRI